MFIFEGEGRENMFYLSGNIREYAFFLLSFIVFKTLFTMLTGFITRMYYLSYLNAANLERVGEHMQTPPPHPGHKCKMGFKL